MSDSHKGNGKMTDPTNLQTLNQAAIDQHWMEMDDRLSDIQRIAICGPLDVKDRILVRAVLLSVTAELYHRRAMRDNGNP